MIDLVNHPPHYTSSYGIECIEITRHLNFNYGNAVKYMWRRDLKGNSKQDLEKTIWYLRDEIIRIESTPEFKSIPYTNDVLIGNTVKVIDLTDAYQSILNKAFVTLLMPILYSKQPGLINDQTHFELTIKYIETYLNNH